MPKNEVYKISDHYFRVSVYYTGLNRVTSEYTGRGGGYYALDFEGSGNDRKTSGSFRYYALIVKTLNRVWGHVLE
jgi:hypothetical protein